MPVDDVWYIPSTHETHVVWTVCSRIVCAFIIFCSKVWLRLFNTLNTYREDILHEAITTRPKGQPLITVTNHTSLLDGPLMANLLRWRYMLNVKYRVFWVPGAKDVIFNSLFSSVGLQMARTIPIVRGDGVYQRPMGFLLNQLDQGDWVHIFPEGRLNMEHEFIRFKWGMDDVLPTVKPYVPRRGKKITAVVGEAMDFSKAVEQMKRENKSAEDIRKYVTDQIQDAMMKLKTESENLHFSRVTQ